MELKTLANLALSKIGEQPITHLGDSSSKSARLAALHLEPTLREVLRAHFWGFALAVRPLAAQDVREYLEISGNLKVGTRAVPFPPLYQTAHGSSTKTYYEGASGAGALWSGDAWTLSAGTDGSWRSTDDVATPDLADFHEAAPPHWLETNLAGQNNDIRYEQVDQAAGPAAVQYLAEAETAHTAVSVSGRTLTVTPGSRARMIITGATTTGVTGVLRYAGIFNGRPCWTTNGALNSTSGSVRFTSLSWDSGDWRLIQALNLEITYASIIASTAFWPDALTFPAPAIGTGTPAVASGASSAYQVVSAINHPDPLKIIIEGLVTDAAGLPLIFPELVRSGPSYGLSAYSNSGDITNATHSAAWNGDRWQLLVGTAVCFESGDDQPSPDLCSSWVPVGLASGTPAITASLSDVAPAALVSTSHKRGNNGTGAISTMTKTTLSGGVSGRPVVRRVTPAVEMLGWKHAFLLPDGFLKIKELRNSDTGRKIDKFTRRRISGKNCILCNVENVSLEFVEYVRDPDAYDADFIAAAATLLAARLARAISGSDDLEAKFLQIYQDIDLPAARTSSGQETDSNENHPLREFLNGTLTPGRGDFFPNS